MKTWDPVGRLKLPMEKELVGHACLFNDVILLSVTLSQSYCPLTLLLKLCIHARPRSWPSFLFKFPSRLCLLSGDWERIEREAKENHCIHGLKKGMKKKKLLIERRASLALELELNSTWLFFFWVILSHRFYGGGRGVRSSERKDTRYLFPPRRKMSNFAAPAALIRFGEAAVA